MENTEWLYKYLNNQLTVSELKDFQSMVEVDENFKQEFEVFKNINIYNNTKDQKLKGLQALNEVHDNFKLSTKKTWVSRYKFYLLLLATLLMVIFGYYVFIKTDSQNSEKKYAALIEKYFQPNQISLTEKSNENENQLQIESAVTSFNSQEYKKTLTLLSKIDITDHKEKAILLLMNGISLAYENNCQEAIKILNQLAVEFDIFSNDANYYIALCHIKSHDFNTARQYLQKIALGSNLHTKSVNLITELEKK